MDDIKTPKPKRASTANPTRRVLAAHNSRRNTQPMPAIHGQHTDISDSFNLDEYVSIIKKRRRRNLQKFKRVYQKYFATTRRRVVSIVTIAVLLLFAALPVLQDKLNHRIYALGTAESAVLTPTSPVMAKEITYDGSQGVYNFNKNYVPRNPGADKGAGGPLVTAKIYKDPAKGLQLTDPVNKVDFTMKPLFDLGEGKQQENRFVYPTFKGRGHLVYTAGAVGVKEDITLQQYVGDKLSFSYQLDLGDSYGARIEKNGAVGIYGSSLPISGNVSTGSDKDAALLKKARQSAAKDKLLFTLPAPVIHEANRLHSAAKAKFTLKGDKLTVTAEHLKGASYPLSIDPTVTAAFGSGLFSFDANIETNIYVDPSNNFFERSPLTGGNLLTWTAQTGVAGTNPGVTAAAHFLGGALVYGGTLYVIGGASTTTTTNLTGASYIEQAKINSDGSVGIFSTGNATGLPAGGIARFQLLTYNGYIYIIDGITGFTSTAATGTVSNAVYYTRITSESFSAFANGAQLKNWSVIDGATQPTKVPPTAVYDYGATVYNGSLYLAGGLNSAGTAQTAALYAAILPSGDLGTFNSAAAALPAGRFGMDMQAYNNHLYILGGNTGTLGAAALTATTLYASIASDGSIADAAWKTGNSLVSSNGSSTQVMENFGTQFSMIYNGYLYVTGGCGAVNSTGSCTSVLAYTQLAQINADGSLGTFFPNDFQNGGTSTLTRTGTPTFGYNGNMYSIAGCSAMNSGTVSCGTTWLTSNFAAVNTVVGDISANRTPTALPVALYGQSTVVLNGFIYVIGGCLTVSCNGSRVANYITYVNTINADGSLGGSWSSTGTDPTNATSLHFDGESTPLLGSANCSTGGTDQCGLAGAAATVYNGYIYVVGGNDGSAYNSAVYYMQPNASTGVTGTWTKGNTINTAVTELGAFASNGSLYTIGGCSGTTGIGCSTYSGQVQRSVLSQTTGVPGAFTPLSGAGSQLQLPAAGRSAFGLAYYGGYIYLAGGIQGGGTDADNQLDTVVRAKINSSGDIVTVSSGWAATNAKMTKARRRAVASVVNGYLYIIGGHNACDPVTGPPCSGPGTTYGDIQIGKIDLSSGGSGDIAGTSNLFTKSSTSTLTSRWNPAVAFGNGFMYVTGGCTAGPPPAGCTTIGTTDESFVVYNADNLGVNSWNAQSHTPAADLTQANRLGAGSAVYNGNLYIAGGCTTFTMTSPTLTCSAVTNTTAYAPIKADGTLGTWISGGTFTTGTGFGQLVTVGGYLYYLGGQTGGIANGVSTIYYSQINASTGAPGAWTATTKGIGDTGSGGQKRTQFGAVVYANRIFVVGGYDSTAAANTATVFVSPDMSSGGDINGAPAWTSTTAFSTIRRELSLVSAGAYLYVIGGYDGTTNYYADVQVATPNTSTGAISSWSFNNEIPYKWGGMSAVGSNGYIFAYGGRNGTTSTSCSASVYSAPVNGNGTVGDWQQAPNSLANARFGAATGFYNGYFYLSGGDNCTNIITGSGGTNGTTVIEQSGQLSEAIHATYTRYVDFGTDATFRQLYVLGTNAQISGTDIDRWKIFVKTSTSANNSWGQKTSFTLSNFGYSNPITFQALNASGVDQGASQYWDITFDIDQAQSFNFPDSSTPPQITKYDFYFSPGPGKRLRDGKTFINESQTTLDAHP